MISSAEKISALRACMRAQQIDAYVILSSDPHMSEYLPEYWQGRQWLSGFTGSVGTLVICQDFAGLWVDARYWVQAERQLAGSDIQLQKMTHEPSTSYSAWLAAHLSPNARLAVDGQTLSIQQFNAFEAALDRRVSILLQQDLLSSLWQERPSLPQMPIYTMDEGINALSRADKLSQLRTYLKQQHIEAHFISALDDIAWLLNCRGSDVEFNPVFLAHLYVHQQGQTVLFVDQQKLSEELRQQLQQEQISLQPYAQSAEFLASIDAASILLDASKVSIVHQQALPSATKIEYQINPSTRFKACKQPTEIEQIRQTMVKDGVALCQFFAWLEQALAAQQVISELMIDEKLTEFRRQQAGFIGLSFATIAGFAENGALPHYRATDEQFSYLDRQGLLLIDSGGQYQSGTTDITRVVPIGTPSAAECFDYTLVLKAHIALAETVFPDGIAAPLLDAIGRQMLWRHQLDYRHGTGHGVGYALNVHEGPQSISYYSPIHPHSAMLEGMVSSIEPGLYREGQWGIRIENLVVNQKLAASDNGFGDYLAFETLTLCPIDVRCVQLDLLNQSEKDWLNQYHAMVRQQLAAHLDAEALDWLMRHTAAI